MTYDLKILQEIAWGVLIAVIVAGAQGLLTFDASVIDDWNKWALTLLSACVRAGVASLIAIIGVLLKNRSKITMT
jgi:hypothetical protein